jgi:hypothetical protein
MAGHYAQRSCCHHLGWLGVGSPAARALRVNGECVRQGRGAGGSPEKKDGGEVVEGAAQRRGAAPLVTTHGGGGASEVHHTVELPKDVTSAHLRHIFVERMARHYWQRLGKTQNLSSSGGFRWRGVDGEHRGDVTLSLEAWLGSGCAETSCHQRVRGAATMAVVGALATSWKWREGGGGRVL